MTKALSPLNALLPDLQRANNILKRQPRPTRISGADDVLADIDRRVLLVLPAPVGSWGIMLHELARVLNLRSGTVYWSLARLERRRLAASRGRGRGRLRWRLTDDGVLLARALAS